MDEYLEIISVPAIAAIVYGVIAVINYAVKKNETFQRFIPLISMGLGIVLGITAYYSLPSILPADNIFTAILIGGISGISSVGINQTFTSFKKSDDTNKNDSKTDNNKENTDKNK